MYSGQEVRAIADLLKLPGGNILTGPRALEANVKEASASVVLAQARYVQAALENYYERGGLADKARAAREKAKKLGASLPEE